MTASDRSVRGATRRVESQPEPPRPCPGTEAGGAVAPGLQSEGADTDPRPPRPCPAAPHRAAASAQPGPASCSRGRCHPLELSPSPLPPAPQPPPPRCCSSCSGLLPPPLPRPLCPRAQPIAACRRGLLAQSPRSSRPPHCSAPGVMHCQSLCDAATPAFPVGPRRHRHGPS